MYPVLFHVGGIAVYSYGFMIALGAIAGVSYMAVQGKKEAGLTFDQANTLFLILFLMAFLGGKFFLFLEDPALHWSNPGNLIKGRGFVFYGSFLFAVPAMIWFFKRNKLNMYVMLDVMAITTCLVHIFGRFGCFLAGCCYGTQTDSVFGVIFNDPQCFAQPKDVPLHPTQLYESFYIFLVMIALLYVRGRRRFYGQLFLLYLMLYAIGRSVIELFRGDEARGYVVEGFITHSQFIAMLIFLTATFFYWRWSKQNLIVTKIKKGA
jgi:phosphatidylglycerol:prolipoprotein diacylglycerol transferase